MAKPGQASFRRILLARILLLSIPVLLTGEFVAYKKARSSLLESARQNLTESAVRKGETIRDLIESTRSNVVAASAAFAASVKQPAAAQPFVDRLTRWLPADVQCVQVIDLKTGQATASTCGQSPIAQLTPDLWANSQSSQQDPLAQVRISPVQQNSVLKQFPKARQLNLVFSAPILQGNKQPRYALSVQLALQRQAAVQRGSFSGETVVIDQDGTILAHPNADRIGGNIQQEADATRLAPIVQDAIAGKQDFLYLFSLERNGELWLAGYSPLKIAMAPGAAHTWVILAVVPEEKALYGLDEVKQVLIILTLGLVFANLLAALYLARDLALPIEKLSDFALRIHHRQPAEQVPKNFKVKELNQLAAALDSMVERLEERAEELEAAWQEAQVANQLKSEFLATTSHELRTPLNAIIGCVRLIRDGCCDSREEELEFLLQADEAAIHLLKIINDLLDISKIEAGKVELNLQPVSIPDLCEQCLKMVQPGAEKKHLSLSIEIDDQLQQVPLDERRVRQMLINLLSNAVKFTPERGQVKLRARMGFGDQLAQDIRPDRSPINHSTPYLCLEVIDSGIGIPKERWHLLFRPFQQIDSSLTRKHEGTGLGLALTKRLTELHGGTISFRSTPGAGSTFRIWLPAPPPRQPPDDRTLNAANAAATPNLPAPQDAPATPLADPSISSGR
jgi:signal transduction histidine kinase